LQGGGCACIIVNTVKVAQKIYEECKNQIENAQLILCHAQFTMPDRYKKEKALLEKMGKHSRDEDRKWRIVIGTQVLEQSLDYDADIMVTQLCPMDLLLQRIGRLHRHERDGRVENCSRPEGLRNPECIILREEEETYDTGTRTIYGDYLLMRTEQIMPEVIRIPGDISALVQKVYDEGQDLGLAGKKYTKAKERNKEKLRGKRQEAKMYLLQKPTSKMIQGFLDNVESSSEKMAEVGVRDGVSSIEVLLMKRGEDGEILFTGENEEKGFRLWAMEVPDCIQSRRIAMERLKLPHLFCTPWNRNETIRELEEKNRMELAQWQLSPWLHGELILVLDQKNRGELNGYVLQYSQEKGLEYEKKEEEDAGKGV